MKQIPHQRSIFNSHSSSKGLSLKTIRRRKHQPSVNRWWRRYIASRSLVSSNRINAAFFVCVCVSIPYFKANGNRASRLSTTFLQETVSMKNGTKRWCTTHRGISRVWMSFFFCTGVIRMDQRYIFFRVPPNTWITQTLFNSHLWGKTQALPDSFVKPNTGWQ